MEKDKGQGGLYLAGEGVLVVPKEEGATLIVPGEEVDRITGEEDQAAIDESLTPHQTRPTDILRVLQE